MPMTADTTSNTNNVAEPTIAIITALPHEYAAVKVLLESPEMRTVEGASTNYQYLCGMLPASDGGQHSLVLALLTDMGNNMAAAEASLLLQQFPSIDTIIMCGIAGAVPHPEKVDEHVRLGDIVATSRAGVVDYGFNREIRKGSKIVVTPRHPPRPPSASLLRAARSLQTRELTGERPWLGFISQALKLLGWKRPPGQTDKLASTLKPGKFVRHPRDPKRTAGHPRVFLGLIGSSNTLQKNPAKRDYLRDQFGVRAIEMEASGVSDAAWLQEKQYFIVRGTCDYCDQNKGDDWQNYAAVVAAAYTRALLEALPARRLRDDERSTGASRQDASVVNPQQYVDSLQAYCDEAPYLALNTLLGDKWNALDELYVPLYARPRTEVASNKAAALSLGNVMSRLAAGDTPRALFIGVGGAGKSTLLRHLARCAWNAPALVGLNRQYLPIIIRLQALATTQNTVFEKRVVEAMHAAGELLLADELPSGFLSGWPRETGAPWLFLLDGFDEVPSDDRERLLQLLRRVFTEYERDGHLFLLTSRPDDELIGQLGTSFVTYDLLGFTRSQQREFARHWFQEEADAFLREVARVHSNNVISTPLLITIAAAVFHKYKQLPDQRARLYERFIKIWLDEARVRKLKEELGEHLFLLVPGALAHIARLMTELPEANTVAKLRPSVASYLEHTLGWSGERAYATADGLLETLGRRSAVLIRTGDVFEWAHATLRVHFAARALKRELEIGADYSALLGDKIFNDVWEEAVTALVELSDDPNPLIDWLSGQVIAEGKADNVPLLWRWWNSRAPETKDEEQSIRGIVEALVVAFDDLNSGGGPEREAIEALVEMGTSAVPRLIEILAETNAILAEILSQRKAEKKTENQTEDSESHHSLLDEPRGMEQISLSRRRHSLLEVLGRIGSEDAVEPLLSLLDDENFHVRGAARVAIGRIGAPAVPYLLNSIADSHSKKEGEVTTNCPSIEEGEQRTEKICLRLGALREIGLRDDRISESLTSCLREGAAGNDRLLACALRTARGLRDVHQRDQARAALMSENLDVVTAAADFYIDTPDPSAVSDLNAALARISAGDELPGTRGYANGRLLIALAATGQPSAFDRVVTILEDSLAGKGAMSANRAEQNMDEIRVPQTRSVYLLDLLRRLKENPKDYFNSVYTVALGSTWRVEDLHVLTNATQEFEGEGISVAESLFRAIGEATRQKGEHSYREHDGQQSAVRLAAKSESKTFVEEACRLLPLAKRYLSELLAESLWVVGDERAEPALLQKFDQERQPGAEDDLHADLIRALSTCGGKPAAQVLLEYLRSKDLKIYLPTHAYYLLVMRGMLNENDLIGAVGERDAVTPHGRADALWTLGAVSPERHQALFLSIAAQADEDEQIRYCAARLLKRIRDVSIIAVQKALLKDTDSKAVAEEAALSLANLKAYDAIPDIEKAFKRFGNSPHSFDFLIALARLGQLSALPLLIEAFETTRPIDYGLVDSIGELLPDLGAQEFLLDLLDAGRSTMWDIGEQKPVVRALAQHAPKLLTEQVLMLYHAGRLDRSARETLAGCIPQLLASVDLPAVDGNVSPLLTILMRLVSDEHLPVRERAALVLSRPDHQPWCLGVYKELVQSSSTWERACAVYLLGLLEENDAGGSAVSGELEQARFDREYMIRRAADAATAMRECRHHLAHHVEKFARTIGLSRLSAYLCLKEHGDERTLYDLDKALDTHDHARILLVGLRGPIKERMKKDRQERAKKEEERFPSRVVAWPREPQPTSISVEVA